MKYSKWLHETSEFTNDDGTINADSNGEILSHIYQEVFHLLDAIPSHHYRVDAGRIAATVQREVAHFMFTADSEEE